MLGFLTLRCGVLGCSFVSPVGYFSVGVGWAAGRFVVVGSVCGFWRAWFVDDVLGFGWL